METNVSSATGIQPSQRTNTTNKSGIVGRDGGGSSSGFAPRTNVSIANSVNDMAGILSKVSDLKSEMTSAVPKEIQQMIDNIMKSSFTVEASIGEGVGSSLASSRFSSEQLMVLSRLLGQMSELSSKGELEGVSDELKVLLSAVRDMAVKEGVPSAAMLNKLAFQLLDGKGTDELSQVMQLLLGQAAGQQGVVQQDAEDDGLNFLKQLVDSFFPKSMFKGASGGDVQSRNQPQAQNQPQDQNQLQAQNQPQAQNQSQPQQTSNQAENSGLQAKQHNQPQLQNSNAASRSYESSQPQAENNPLFRNIFARYAASSSEQVAQQPQASQQQTVNLQQNTQAMDAMKSLAELLMKDAALSEKDVQLLQNFINGNKDGLSQQDAKQLTQLLKMVQSNIPAALQNAAIQLGVDNLPKLWAFVQLCELAQLKNMKAKELKDASRKLNKFASVMKGAGESSSSVRTDGQKTISFMMPLYLGENEKSYPAYVHIYDGEPQDEMTGEKKKETWLRICVLTDNIGAVELTCRLYEGNSLNLKVNFSDDTVIKEFSEYIPDIQASFADSPLELKDIKVGAVK